MNDFENYLFDASQTINKKLNDLLNLSYFCGRESPGLELMLEAMSYSVEGGGKRIRPFLTLEFCRMFGGNPVVALLPACAVEMVHTYSLIHDDLPCMDNDDMRRGKPSNHIKFGYANALLAGDALLTLAFEIISGDGNLTGEIKSDIIHELASAAGASGMVAGQVMDLMNEKKKADIETIGFTDRLKTGKMICAAGKIGCIIAGVGSKDLHNARVYCENIGLAFQVVDDILDITSTKDVLGKPVGSDIENNKSTYVSLLGSDKAKNYAEELTENAVNAISGYKNSHTLIQLAHYLCNRIY